MGKPMMLLAGDHERIEALKAEMGAVSKIEVVRTGLELLEKELERKRRIERWRNAILTPRTPRDAHSVYPSYARSKQP